MIPRRRYAAIAAAVALVAGILAVTLPVPPPATAHPQTSPPGLRAPGPSAGPSPETAPETVPSATESPERLPVAPTAARTPVPATRPTAGPTVPPATTPQDTATDSPTPSNPPTPDATTDPEPTPSDTPTDTGTPTPEPAGTTLQVWLTGYSWFDNDPPGSAAIAYPQIHDQAGGSGTYTDPVTLAVGRGGWTPGTLVYLPSIHRYAIVEDLCGSCAQGHNGLTWIDVYVNGQAAGNDSADDCMGRLTAVVEAVLNPGPGLPVVEGPISDEEGCHL